MNLNDAKALLEKRRIPYHMAQYEDEADYWRHIMPCPDLRLAGSCRVSALVIPAPNGTKYIELQFNRVRGAYVFEELWFGGYSFDLSDTGEEFLEAEILEVIRQIADGKLAIIAATDLKKKRCISAGSFDLTDDDNVFGAPGFREAVAKIDAPKTFRQKLTGRTIQYDIYDWRTYRQIVK